MFKLKKTKMVLKHNQFKTVHSKHLVLKKKTEHVHVHIQSCEASTH